MAVNNVVGIRVICSLNQIGNPFVRYQPHKPRIAVGIAAISMPIAKKTVMNKSACIVSPNVES